MAAGHEPGGAVLGGEVVDREDHAHADRRPRPGDGVEGIVGVPGLRLLARMDRDRLRRGEQVPGLEELLAQAEDARMLDQIVEQPMLGHQRVDALGGVALEAIAAAVMIEIRRQGGAELGQHLRVEQALEDHVSLVADDRRLLLDDAVVLTAGHRITSWSQLATPAVLRCAAIMLARSNHDPAIPALAPPWSKHT
jgi:hypothetical protein